MANILHYKGDVRATMIGGSPQKSGIWPMGPDLHGAWYAPYKVEYDAEVDRSTVYFKSGTYVDMLNFLDPSGNSVEDPTGGSVR